MRARRSLRSGAPLAAATLLGLVGCGSLLGIEDVSREDRPGNSDGGAPNGGSPGSNGGEGAAGGQPPNGGGGAGTTGGSSLGGGGSGTAGEGGASGEGGSAGAGGTPAQGSTVSGKVIDRLGHPLRDLLVEISGQTAVTDAQGRFEVNDVPERYDASLAVEWHVAAQTRSYGYAYLGLTRRDPTLQVYEALDRRFGDLEITTENNTWSPPTRLRVSVGGKDGSDHYTVNSGGGNVTPNWEGAAITSATAHALLYTADADTGLPAAYLAYDQKLIALSENGQTDLALDLTPDTIPTGSLSGTTPEELADAQLTLFLRFPTSDFIRLADLYPAPTSFSFLVPTVTGASLSLALSEGQFDGDYSVVHRDGLAAPQGDIAFTVPRPPELRAPATGALNVTSETVFRVQPAAGGAKAYVAVIDDAEEGPYHGIYVVTDETEFTLPPILGGGFTLRTGVRHTWRAETHGTLDTVDACAGPNGFIDSFAWAQEYPYGPRQGDGVYTISGPREFTTASD